MQSTSRQDPLNVLYVAAESFPLVKVGGLADVAGSLPKALSRLGHDVRVALPFYAAIELGGDDVRPGGSVAVGLAGNKLRADVLQTWHPNGMPAYLIANRHYFGREQVYGYPDDDERFIFFSRALVAFLAASPWVPDIVHCNDWHSALVPCLLRTGPDADRFSAIATAFTIHNLAYQGPYTKRTRQLMGVPDSVEGNIMAMGIRFGDVINTVSATFLSEILTPAQGEGMDGLVRERLPDVWGILNGLDYEEFNPRKDPRIPAWYDVRSIPKRSKNKSVLQHWSRLPLNESTPLLGVVSRLAEQKGFDIICDALDELLEMGIQLVVMGRGEDTYEEMVGIHAERYPASMSYHQRDDETLARLIYAGSDMLLAPSNFEPCGLAPLIAMRYGAVPIVRATGGLADTVIDYSVDPDHGLGFSFVDKRASALVDAVGRALDIYYRRHEWQTLVRRLMATDLSWEASSREYVRLYRHALRKRLRSLKATGTALKTAPGPGTGNHPSVRRRAV